MTSGSGTNVVDFMKLVDESGVTMPDGRPWPEDAPKMTDPGNEVYVTRIDSAGEYRDSVNWLVQALDALREAEYLSERDIYDGAIAIRKYTRTIDRRSQYDLMCKRLQRAKIGQSTETRLVLESIIKDIEKEFL